VGKTSVQVKERYNEANYARYVVRIRQDSELYEDVEKFMSQSGTSFNFLVNKLLKEHFDGVEK